MTPSRPQCVKFKWMKGTALLFWKPRTVMGICCATKTVYKISFVISFCIVKDEYLGTVLYKTEQRVKHAGVNSSRFYPAQYCNSRCSNSSRFYPARHCNSRSSNSSRFYPAQHCNSRSSNSSRLYPAQHWNSRCADFPAPLSRHLTAARPYLHC